MSKFHQLTVDSIIQETENSVEISFNIPSALKEVFAYLPGQYITIEKEVNGEVLRRAYSICAPINSEKLKIGVKRVPKGTFSVFATTVLKAGDRLSVSPPEGRFVLDIDADNSKSYLAFAAGSGITPVLSMISSAMALEEKSKFVLVYGNKNPEEMMFKSALSELKTAYPDRFFIEHQYSQTKQEDSLFGRIDTSTLNYILKNKYTSFQFDSVFLCGPESMINNLKEVLIENGFKKDQILFELFTTPVASEIETESLEGSCSVSLLLDDEEHHFSMDKSKTILEIALSNGLDAPYSCQGGICSTCLGQITDGKAMMDKNSILTDDEVESGLILTCQAHPITDKITIDYDDV